MLETTKKRSFSDARVVTIIGQGTTIIGEIKAKGTIRIEGVVSGKVHSDEAIVIQETGRVKADLQAAQVAINGEVEGNVFASERIEIAGQGKLVGDINSPRVSIAEGVLFEGKCIMKPAGAASPQQAAGTTYPEAANPESPSGSPDGRRTS
jgi:cytoskeletal protein CcmA (bactofilin family)